jgi:predicted nucleotidyltransferase component of viral defense system
VTRKISNVAVSVRDRLLEHTRRKRGNFQLTLRRYLVERFLYRLGQSRHREHFVLKGAMLFVLWDASIYRPTKDLDLAGFWTNDEASLIAAIREILAIPCPEDGISFVIDAITAEPIRHQEHYHGFRVRVLGILATAKVSLQIDVGFGDAIEPPAVFEAYPVALDAPAPLIRAYPREAAIAEKLHAMVSHGLENSRYKDFYDVYLLSSRFAFSGASMAAAITATFTRRNTTELGSPVALTDAFYDDPARAGQWLKFLQRTKLGSDVPADFAFIGLRIKAFLEAPVQAIQIGGTFAAMWSPGGPWR